MKIVLMVLACLGLVFFQMGCKGSEGPQGPAGPAGDSTHALEGFAAGIQCGTCHNPDMDTSSVDSNVIHLEARKYQWSQSRHATGGTSERNNVPCSGCHTTEGFMQRASGHSATPQLTPTPIGCFACHSPHSRGNFTLRTMAPATITSNTVGVADTTFNYGKGNLCAQCHQPRTINPKMNPNAAGDSIVVTSSFWEPHYGTQSAMLSGTGGVKFPGYSYSGNSYHTTAAIIKEEGCPTCHMAKGAYPPQLGTNKAGGHTMKISYEAEGGGEAFLLTGCTQSGCHAAMTDPDFAGPTTAPVGAQTAVTAALDSLKILLAQRGYIDTTSAFPVKLTNGKLVIKPAKLAGALYNYHLVEADGSEGVHNTKYSLDLLRSSIQLLRQNPQPNP